MKEKLPKSARKVINAYFNLKLNGKNVRCPYYINIKKMRQRMGLRVLIGKGSPEEITHESLIYEKLRDVDFAKMSEREIRDFLTKRRIGIDCSGFIVNVLNQLLKKKKKKALWKYLKFPKQSLYRKIARYLRPIENISANLLTGDLNSYQVSNLNNVKPGDLIRTKESKRSESLHDAFHIMLISEVEKANGKVSSFTYVHSTRLYEDAHGVRKGKVIIRNLNGSLCKQKWTDEYNGKNWTRDEICSNENYSQVRRLKNVSL